MALQFRMPVSRLQGWTSWSGTFILGWLLFCPASPAVLAASRIPSGSAPNREFLVYRVKVREAGIAFSPALWVSLRQISSLASLSQGRPDRHKAPDCGLDSSARSTFLGEKDLTPGSDAGSTRTAWGEVKTVDIRYRTLDVSQGHSLIILFWDKHAKFLEADHSVKPSALMVGSKICVAYEKKNRRNWVHFIVIAPDLPEH